MKLLFVLSIGFDKGGPSVHLLTDVIESALKRGHSCHVVLKKTTDSAANGLEKLSEKFGDLLSVSLVNDMSGKKKGFVKRYFADCAYAFKTKNFYKRNKYDVAFLQSCNVGWVHMAGLKRLCCPIVFNIQDIFPQNLQFSGQLPFSKITYPLFRALQRVAYNKADKIITISDDMKETLVNQGIPQNKIEVVYNWSYADDPIKLSDIPKDCVFDLNMNKSKTNVVYAGNIGKMQNVELIAEAARLSKDDNSVHYYIIGDGANKAKVLSIVEGLDNVTILPMQPSRYAESIYAQADINVIPLAKGGIKTALPSKTATVLRTGKYVVFCIDVNSKFEQMLCGMKCVKVVDNENGACLYSAIKDYAIASKKCFGCDEICTNDIISVFSQNNAAKYSEHMERMADSIPQFKG